MPVRPATPAELAVFFGAGSGSSACGGIGEDARGMALGHGPVGRRGLACSAAVPAAMSAQLARPVVGVAEECRAAPVRQCSLKALMASFVRSHLAACRFQEKCVGRVGQGLSRRLCFVVLAFGPFSARCGFCSRVVALEAPVEAPPARCSFYKARAM